MPDEFVKYQSELQSKNTNFASAETKEMQQTNKERIKELRA